MKKHPKKPSIHLTFDVEEWPSSTSASANDDNCLFSSEGCSILIDILQKFNVRATFFTTGYFAERKPDIIKKIHQQGHEIANHSYIHQDLKNHNPEDLESEIKRSTDILTNLINDDIKGFRAPFCRYRKDLAPLLKAYNYQYDSSLHPAIVPGRYCNLFSPIAPFQEENGLWEIPISVIPLIHFPISWWWMRNLGSWVTYAGTNINLYLKNNVVLYFHPWEFTSLPKTKKIPYHITQNTGKIFCEQLKMFIKSYDNLNFMPIKEFFFSLNPATL